MDDVPANFDELRELLFADQTLDDALADATLNGPLAEARDLLQNDDSVGAEALLADVDDDAGDEENAWRFFILARARQARNDTDGAISALRQVLNLRGSDSRVQLLAWKALRQLGEEPGEAADLILGVVFEVPVDGALDTLAAYADGSARCFNSSGSLIYWDWPDEKSLDLTRAVLSAASAVIARISPSEREAGTPTEMVRLTALTPGGPRIVEEELDDLESGDNPFSDLFQAASQLMHLLTNTHAISRADESIRSDPKDATAYFNRAQAQANLGNIEAAIADYTEAIALEPFNAEPYHARGWLYFTRDEHEKAVADFDEVIQRQPENADAFKRRALANSLLNRQEAALADYDEAIRLDPNDFRSFNNRGNLHHDCGEFAKAAADYTSALELNPDDAGAFQNRGNTYRAAGQYQKAIADYDEVLRLDPSRAGSAHQLRGICYANLGKYDRAIADFDKWIEHEPENARAFHCRGEVWRLKGDLDKAIADFDEACALAMAAMPGPGITAAWPVRPRTNWIVRGLTTSRAQLSHRSCLYPGAFHQRGRILTRKGEYLRAVADYDQALRLEPDHAQVYFDRAVALTYLHSNDRAIADYTESLQRDPRNSRAHHNRGCVWLRKGEQARALADFEEALRQEPGAPWSLVRRGDLRRLSGDLDGADADFSEAIRNDRENAEAARPARRGRRTAPG